MNSSVKMKGRVINMKVYLNEITGINDAIVTMFLSKRTWTPEIERDIRKTCSKVISPIGKINPDAPDVELNKVNKWIDQLCKWGWKHITMLRYIDLSFTVEGLHRGGQDDWDSHAKRFDNRIIRSSTRLAEFGNEMSDFYKGKILPTDYILDFLNISMPETITYTDGYTYVKTINGYVREDLKNDKDVKRGLYMLSIPSNFIFKVNLTEFAHVYKERNETGTAHPEVKECCESCADLIQSFVPQFNRELLLKIKN